MKASKKELEKIAVDATTDCYDEYEQVAGWQAYLQSNVELPCKCLVGKKEVVLTDFDVNDGGSCLLAVVRVDDNEFKVTAETVTISGKRYSKYLEAYKEWL